MKIIIKGKPMEGKTYLTYKLKKFLEEEGYINIKIRLDNPFTHSDSIEFERGKT